MKRSLKDLSGYTIETKDGEKGKVKDFLFDENQWIVRYLEADFGSLFSSEKLLIPKVFLDSPDWRKMLFPLKLKQADFQKCPKPKDRMPVSRKLEEEIYEFYRLNPYWVRAYMESAGNIFPPRPIKIPSNDTTERKIDSILRSFEEVKGYHINAIDGKLGHIEDIIIDDTDWQLIYVVIDTKNWLPWSKKVIIAVDWMDRISYINREVNIKLSTETIKNAPEFGSMNLVDIDFEKSLYDYYSSSLVK
jgi:sporulation protein YlmC with PRC-barrel domain